MVHYMSAIELDVEVCVDEPESVLASMPIIHSEPKRAAFPTIRVSDLLCQTAKAAINAGTEDRIRRCWASSPHVHIWEFRPYIYVATSISLISTLDLPRTLRTRCQSLHFFDLVA